MKFIKIISELCTQFTDFSYLRSIIIEKSV